MQVHPQQRVYGLAAHRGRWLGGQEDSVFPSTEVGEKVESNKTMTSTSNRELRNRLRVLLRRPENRFCCDCAASEPTFASLLNIQATIANIKKNGIDSDGVEDILAANNNDDNDMYEENSINPTTYFGAFICNSCASAHKFLGGDICIAKGVFHGECT